MRNAGEEITKDSWVMVDPTPTSTYLHLMLLTLARAERPLRLNERPHTCAILDNGEAKCWGDDPTELGRWCLPANPRLFALQQQHMGFQHWIDHWRHRRNLQHLTFPSNRLVH